jgi:hypothetical protein
MSCSLFMVKIIKLDNGGELRENNSGKYWYLDNRLHRWDGPAAVWADGKKFWYIHGKQINCQSQEEFERLIRLKTFW